MYVCVCNAVNDRRVKAAIREGQCSVSALRKHFGFESCCGRCTQCMRNLIEDHRNDRPAKPNQPETRHAR